MKRLVKFLIPAVIIIGIVVIVCVGIVLVPQLRNMSSEYGTSGAIHDIEGYLRANEGNWPSDPGHLDNKYPVDGEVLVDYSTTSAELIAQPDKLKQAVRPRSGKFYTYPHYDEKIDGLLLVLRETNGLKPSEPGQPIGPQSILE